MNGINGVIDFNKKNCITSLEEQIFNEDKSLFIVCEGSIYNYTYLKQSLINRGHIFSTQFDYEVILHCYEEYGTDGFSKLRGKFSFAIYNLNRKETIIARDLAGEKPLYYYHGKDVFLFSSSLKSIVSSGLIKKEIHKKALNQYLQLTYIPAPLTIYNDVYKLLPGHYIIVGGDRGVNIQQYWDVEYKENELIQDYDKCKELLRKTLFNAVEDCIGTNQSIGTFLSGGIDSTIITGIASQIYNKSLDTFTIGYRDKRFDESDRARLSSKLHKTNQHTFYLDYKDVLPDLNRIINDLN